MLRFLSHATLLLVAVIWGLAFVFQKTGMETLDAFEFSALRYGAATLVLLPFAVFEAWRRQPLITVIAKSGEARRLTWGIIALGLTIGSGSLLQQVSLEHTGVANAAFLTVLYVPLVPILGLVFFGHRIIRLRWIAVAIFLMGSLMLTGASFAETGFGDGIVSVGAVFWALHIMLVGWLIRSAGLFAQLAFVQFGISAILSLAFVLVLPASGFTIADIAPAIPELFFTGILSTALAFTLQIIGQRHASNTAAAFLLSLEGVFAAIAGWLLLGQVMGNIAIAGAVLILLAVLIIEATPQRRIAGETP